MFSSFIYLFYYYYIFFIQAKSYAISFDFVISYTIISCHVGCHLCVEEQGVYNPSVVQIIQVALFKNVV